MDKAANPHIEQLFRKCRVPLRPVKREPHIDTLRRAMSGSYQYDPDAFRHNFQFPGVSRRKADAFVEDAVRERRDILTGLGIPIVHRMSNWKLPVPLAVYADGSVLRPGRKTTETVLNAIPGYGYGTLRRQTIEANGQSRKLDFTGRLKHFLNNWRTASQGGRYTPSDKENAATDALKKWREAGERLDKFRSEYQSKLEVVDPAWEENRAFANPAVGQTAVETVEAFRNKGWRPSEYAKLYAGILQHEASHNNTPVVYLAADAVHNPNRIVEHIPGALESPTEGYFTNNWGKRKEPWQPTSDEAAAGIGQLRRLQYNATGKLTRGWDEYLKEEMRRGTIYKGRNGRLYYREGKMFGSSNPAGISADQSGIHDLLEAGNNFEEHLGKLQRGTPEWKKTFVQYAIFKANRDRLFRTAY